MVPFQFHSLAFGGFEIQMLDLMKSLKKINVDVEKINPWDKDDNYDILHFWGLEFEHLANMGFAKKAKKKIVLTALLGYMQNDMSQKLVFYYSKYFRKVKYLIEVINLIDKLVVVNNEQAMVAIKYFNLPSNKIHIIPNIVSDDFYSSIHQNSEKESNEAYILTTGNVCNRKNQLNLAKACKELNVPLFIVGKATKGEEQYAKDLQELIKQTSSITWINGLEKDSKELLLLYNNCLFFALPSFIETQPISVLEAIAVRKPILLGERAYASQKLFLNACLVEPNSTEDIKKGIKKIMNSPTKYIPPHEDILQCKELEVAKKYKNLYEELFN